jgi:hypothetical protein
MEISFKKLKIELPDDPRIPPTGYILIGNENNMTKKALYL